MTTSVPDLMHSEPVMSTSVPDLMHPGLFKSAHFDPFERLRKKVFSNIFSLYPPSSGLGRGEGKLMKLSSFTLPGFHRVAPLF